MHDPTTKQPPTSPLRLRRRFKLLTVLVLIQALFIVGVAVSYYAVGWFGKEIRIQTVPVDPTDLLYGDSVRLKYEISQLDSILWKGTGKLPVDGMLVYVVLKPKDNKSNATYEAIGLYNKKPAIQTNEVLLKGRVDYSYEQDIHLIYGLESYYLSENAGKGLEKHAANAIAKIKIAPWGRAIIEDLELPQ